VPAKRCASVAILEGVVQIFNPVDRSPPIAGVIGALQLDVLADRLQNEYGLPIAFEGAGFEVARWISGDKAAVDAFMAKNRTAMAIDLDDDPVFLASSSFSMRYTEERAPDLKFVDIKTLRPR
jgi:peptide chain release factor 3